MPDSITIQSIHTDTRQMAVTLNIEGRTYPKVIPIPDLQDPDVLTAQLQAAAQELRQEMDALIAATQAADAASTPPVADAVNALVGQAIPVDVAPAPAPTPPPADTTPPTS